MNDAFPTDISPERWATGDALGLPLPADAETLREGGAEWLTRAFHAMGSFAPDNRVTAITRCQGFAQGGTGAKALLSVTYEKPGADLAEDLFVKFSRNFADASMDGARFHMGPEIRFAALSRMPDFPVAVPRCLFADYQAESGTGVLITERIAFGRDGIEPQYEKCMDHVMPEPLAHYRALIGTLARLAGSHKGGRLPEYVSSEFPFDHAKALASDRLPYTPQQVANRVARYAQFAEELPQLLPPEIRTPAFIADLGQGAALFQTHENAIKRFLHAEPDLIALCHWNANSDNGWYWRDAGGDLQCGLLDWGSVGQMHVAMTLWGCLSSAELWMWRDHLDALLALFVAEYAAAGGPAVDRAELRTHLLLYTAMMGLCWLMDAPPRVRREVPELALCTGPLDPRITASETARVQLQMMTNFLAFWQREDLTGTLARLFAAV
ncbi:MAG: hypothetical protein EOO76_18240 [Novosphingobium sp.]|nr:MAG: hypothetical protein EOO76_18240 [Novosphingobium sp.]